MIDFNTWSRIIKGQKKESMLDHIYVKKIANVENISFLTPTFGDHVLAIAELNLKINKPLSYSDTKVSQTKLLQSQLASKISMKQIVEQMKKCRALAPTVRTQLKFQWILKLTLKQTKVQKDKVS